MGNYTYLVTKYQRAGDLLNYLHKRDLDKLPESQAQHIFKQLVTGINHIHNAGIIHGDIKHMNILLSDFSATPRVKIADFGFAC